MNYEEFKKRQKEEQDKRFLKKFEECPSGTEFRVLKNSMMYDYEFIEDVKIPLCVFYDRNSSKQYIYSISLYFVKIDDDTCDEIKTGNRFKRITRSEDGYVCFYNEETGLYFDFSRCFEKAVGSMGSDGSIDLDDMYTRNTIYFFGRARTFKSRDNKLKKFNSIGARILKK